MKKILSLMASLTFILTLCACENVKTRADDDSIKIVATIFPPYDFAKNIAGENAQVTALLYPGAESHTFEPSPRDIIAIQEADLFIYGGGASDTWIRETLLSGELKGVNALAMMDAVALYEEEHKEGMEEEEGEETEYDEHVWTSPENAVLICRAICDALCAADPSKAEVYERNTKNYTEKLEKLDTDYREMIANAKRKTVVFGDRFPFLYLAKAYGIDYFAAFPGCASETEPSAATVVFLINKVREEEIPVVFYIEFSSQKVADIICEDTGAKTLLFHSCHNVTQEEKEAGASYLFLMEQNLQNLTEALN